MNNTGVDITKLLPRMAADKIGGGYFCKRTCYFLALM
jgi:hypothetical protein